METVELEEENVEQEEETVELEVESCWKCSVVTGTLIQLYFYLVSFTLIPIIWYFLFEISDLDTPNLFFLLMYVWIT